MARTDDTQKLVEHSIAGDESAAAELYHRYAERLVQLAQQRLPRDLRPRSDGEDVVQSVYRSFFRRLAADEPFTISRSGDLWRLLSKMTINKTIKTIHRHRSAKRDARRHELSDVRSYLDRGPDPTAAAMAMELLEECLRPLDADRRRAIELRLQEFRLDEIADQLGRSERRIRHWLKETHERWRDST